MPSTECSTWKRPWLETDGIVETSTVTGDGSESVLSFELENCGHMTGPDSNQVSSEQNDIAALEQENEGFKEKKLGSLNQGLHHHTFRYPCETEHRLSQ